MGSNSYAPQGERLAKLEQRTSDIADRLVNAASKSDLRGLEDRLKANTQDALRTELKIAIHEMRKCAKEEAEASFRLAQVEIERRETASLAREADREIVAKAREEAAEMRERAAQEREEAREAAARQLIEKRKSDLREVIIETAKIAIAPALMFFIVRILGGSGSDAVEITSAFL